MFIKVISSCWIIPFIGMFWLSVSLKITLVLKSLLSDNVTPAFFFFHSVWVKYLYPFLYFYFLIYFIDYAITDVPFSPLYSPPPWTPLSPTFPLFSLCPWVVYIRSLASTFPILFLTSPCLSSTYHLCYFFSTFSPSLPTHSPADNPPCDLYFCDSVPVFVVCSVCFWIF